MIDVLIENAGFFPIKMFEAIGAAVRRKGFVYMAVGCEGDYSG